MIAAGFGRLAREPNLTDVGEAVVCNFVLAVDEWRRVSSEDGSGRKEKKKYTHFFDFEAWGSAAEVIADMNKGDGITFEATPRENRYEKDEKLVSKVVFRLTSFNQHRRNRVEENNE